MKYLTSRPLQYLLVENWNQIFDPNERERIWSCEPSPGDWIETIELLVQHHSIPHGFEHLLCYIFEASTAETSKLMWKYQNERTAKAIEAVFAKVLKKGLFRKNPFDKGDDRYAAFEARLDELHAKSKKVRFTRYAECRKLCAKFEQLEKDFELSDFAVTDEV